MVIDPEDGFPHDAAYFCSAFSDEAHKDWAKAGQELRRLADKFMKTRARRKVKDQAYGASKFVLNNTSIPLVIWRPLT